MPESLIRRRGGIIEMENAMDTQIIINLAQARANHEKSLAELHKLEADFKASKAYQEWSNVVQTDTELLAKADELFRQSAAELANVEETPKVYIKSDLSEWLKEE